MTILVIRYLVESKHVEVLHKLLRDPVIQQCRLRRDGDDALLPTAAAAAPALPNSSGQ